MSRTKECHTKPQVKVKVVRSFDTFRAHGCLWRNTGGDRDLSRWSVCVCGGGGGGGGGIMLNDTLSATEGFSI